MSQFAEALGRFAPGYLNQHPVVDATGMSGAYDISLRFSPSNMLQPGGNQLSEPNGVTSLFDAIREQLGLKLELQKRPMPVLVIDEAKGLTPN